MKGSGKVLLTSAAIHEKDNIWYISGQKEEGLQPYSTQLKRGDQIYGRKFPEGSFTLIAQFKNYPDNTKEVLGTPRLAGIPVKK